MYSVHYTLYVLFSLYLISGHTTQAQDSTSRLEVVVHRGFNENIQQMAFSYDDRKLACRDGDGRVNLFDLQTYLPEKYIEETRAHNGIFGFSITNPNVLFIGPTTWLLTDKPHQNEVKGSLVPLGHPSQYGYAKDNLFGFTDSLFIFQTTTDKRNSQLMFSDTVVVPAGHRLEQFKAIYPYAVLLTELDNEPYGSKGILMGKKRVLRIYNLAEKRYTDSIATSSVDGDFDIALQKGSLLVVHRISERLSDTLCKSTVEVWKVDRRKQLTQRTTYTDSYEEFIQSVDLSDDGKRLALLTYGQEAIILSTDTPSPTPIPIRLPTYTHSIQLNHAGDVLACAMFNDIGLFLINKTGKVLTPLKTIRQSWLPVKEIDYAQNNLISRNAEQVRLWPSQCLADSKAIMPEKSVAYGGIQPLDSLVYYWGRLRGKKADQYLFRRNIWNQSTKVISLSNNFDQTNLEGWSVAPSERSMCVLIKEKSANTLAQRSLTFYRINDTTARQTSHNEFTVSKKVGGQVPLSVSWSKALNRFVVLIRHLNKQADWYNLHFYDEDGKADRRSLTVQVDTGSRRQAGVGIDYDYIKLSLTPNGDAAYLIRDNTLQDSCKLIRLTDGKLLFSRNKEQLGESYYASVKLEAFAADARQAWIGWVIKKKRYLLQYKLSPGADTASLLLTVPTDNSIDRLRLSEDGSQLAVVTDGVVRVWDTYTGKELYGLYTLRDSNFVAITPDNYYMASRRSRNVQGLGFRIANNVLPINQLDYQYNRPDLVSSQLPQADSQRVNFYRKLHSMRIAARATPKGLQSGVTVVVLRKLSADMLTTQRTYPFGVVAQAENGLKAITVFINDVPVAHQASHRPQTPARQQYTDTLTVDLGLGMNHIEVVATDSANNESICVGAFDMIYQPPKQPASNVYVIAAGVDRYPKAGADLHYAVSDARRVANLFANGVEYSYKYEKNGLYEWAKERVRGIPNQFQLDTLYNESFNEKALEAIRQKLMGSQIDDQILFFYAGHGLLDKDYNFFLATSATDFASPSEGSIAYNRLVALFRDIPARRKLFLIDACHAGEMTKTNRVSPTDTTVSTLLASTSRGVKLLGTKSASSQDVGTYMRIFFSDYQTTDGINMIAASAGSEVAFEGAATKGGVFTSALQQGLIELYSPKHINKNDTYRWSNGYDHSKYICEADADQNGTVSVSELMAYVTNEVNRQTKGQQTPTYRVENYFNDFPVWSPNP